MKAITVCQPYAWLIAEGHKPVENRSSPFTWRGLVNSTVAIHAGLDRKFFSGHALGLVRHAQRDLSVRDRFVGPGDFVFGAIVAVAYVRAVVSVQGARDWLRKQCGRDQQKLFDVLMHVDGPWCILLERVAKLAAPVPCKGQLGAWEMPAEVERAVLEQLAGKVAGRVQG